MNRLVDFVVSIGFGVGTGLVLTLFVTGWMISGVVNDIWEARLIEAGLAHYDPLTAEWILDAEQE